MMASKKEEERKNRELALLKSTVDRRDVELEKLRAQLDEADKNIQCLLREQDAADFDQKLYDQLHTDKSLLVAAVDEYERRLKEANERKERDEAEIEKLKKDVSNSSTLLAVYGGLLKVRAREEAPTTNIVGRSADPSALVLEMLRQQRQAASTSHVESTAGSSGMQAPATINQQTAVGRINHDGSSSSTTTTDRVEESPRKIKLGHDFIRETVMQASVVESAINIFCNKIGIQFGDVGRLLAADQQPRASPFVDETILDRQGSHTSSSDMHETIVYTDDDEEEEDGKSKKSTQVIDDEAVRSKAEKKASSSKKRPRHSMGGQNQPTSIKSGFAATFCPDCADLRLELEECRKESESELRRCEKKLRDEKREGDKLDRRLRRKEKEVETLRAMKEDLPKQNDRIKDILEKMDRMVREKEEVEKENQKLKKKLAEMESMGGGSTKEKESPTTEGNGNDRGGDGRASAESSSSSNVAAEVDSTTKKRKASDAEKLGISFKVSKKNEASTPSRVSPALFNA